MCLIKIIFITYFNLNYCITACKYRRHEFISLKTKNLIIFLSLEGKKLMWPQNVIVRLSILMDTEIRNLRRNPPDCFVYSCFIFILILVFRQNTNMSSFLLATHLLHSIDQPPFLSIRLGAQCIFRVQSHPMFVHINRNGSSAVRGFCCNGRKNRIYFRSGFISILSGFARMIKDMDHAFLPLYLLKTSIFFIKLSVHLSFPIYI